jgi:Haem-NO-binding
MRGIVITEFLDFVARAFPAADPPTPSPGLGSSLSPVATYPESGLRDLVAQVSRSAQCSEAAVLRDFGSYLFGRFFAIYPVFFEGPVDSLGFLATLHDQVHGDLQRFHPDAELPDLRCERRGSGEFVLDYRSPRALADLAEGLVLGCIEHFGDDVRMTREDLPGPPGRAVRFTLCAAEPARLASARAASA